MPGILDMMGYIGDQGEQGRKRGLAALVGKAYNAPQAERQQILGTVAARGEPGMAYDAQKHFEGLDDTARQKLGQYAVAFDALPDEQKSQAYPQLAAQAQALGIPAPPQWNPAFAPNIQKLAQALGGAGKSSELATFSAMTAGMSPEEIARARRINLGLDPRAVTGAIKFDTFAGADGRPRPQRNNPSTGGVEIFYDEMGKWVPLGQGGQGVPAPQAAMPAVAQQDGEFAQFAQAANKDAASRGEPMLSQTELMTIYRQMKSGQDVNSAAPVGAQAAPQGASMPQVAPVISGLGVGRRPEDEAFAKEDATQRAQLGYLPQRGVIEAQTAGMKEGATQAVQIQAAGPKKAAEIAATNQGEIDNQNLVRKRDADQTLVLLKEAEKLIPQSTGSTGGHLVDIAAGAVGLATGGARAVASLQTIAGQLTSRMPRMQGPQSDKDVLLYKQMAGDLANPSLPREVRMSALRTIRALNQKYASAQSNGDQPHHDPLGIL